MSRQYSCFRCSDSIETDGKPIEKVANYICGADTFETEKREVHHAVLHSPRSRKLTKEIRAESEQMNPEDRDIEKMAVKEVTDEELAFGLVNGEETDTGHKAKPTDFRRKVVQSPSELADDPDFIKAETEFRDAKVQKTGIVCDGCLSDEDTHIW